MKLQHSPSDGINRRPGLDPMRDPARDRMAPERVPGRATRSQHEGEDNETAARPEMAPTSALGSLAAGGVAGASSPLPHLDRIRAAFGSHDVSRIRVATDSTATKAARGLGARAYAYGEAIAAPGAMDLRTAAHEAAHVVQQRAGAVPGGDGSQPGDASETEADAVADAVVRGSSAAAMLDAMHARGGGARAMVQRIVDAHHPEDCPTFEVWMAQFRDLPTFQPADAATTEHGDPNGFPSFGDAAAPRAGDDQHRDPSPTAVHGAVAPAAGDRFIDHPTDAWVRANLPAELHDTAYQLPTDCADIAAILRHVWLVAHARTERYVLRMRRGSRRITLGVGLGGSAHARQARLRGEIAGGRNSHGVSSASARGMVMQYRDASGAPLLTATALAPRIHPGDMVVWEHRYVAGNRPYGGHVQTVQSVTRDGSGNVTQVHFVAGNQPLGPDDADAIRGRNPEETGARGMSVEALRNAPGRRLELQQESMNGAGAGPEPLRWGWSGDVGHDGSAGYTVAIAVGPASAVAAPRHAGAPVRIADWVARLTAARDAATLEATLEAALQEARAAIEGAAAGVVAVAPADLQALGAAASAGVTRVTAARHAHHGAPLVTAPALRARLRATVDALAPEAGSAMDGEVHGAGPSGTSSRNPRANAVRAAFAPVRDALVESVTTVSTRDASDDETAAASTNG